MSVIQSNTEIISQLYASLPDHDLSKHIHNHRLAPSSMNQLTNFDTQHRIITTSYLLAISVSVQSELIACWGTVQPEFRAGAGAGLLIACAKLASASVTLRQMLDCVKASGKLCCTHITTGACTEYVVLG